MILLDTNVASAVMKTAPDRSVLTWLDAQESEELYLSTVTIAEIGFGLSVLPSGKRRRGLENQFEQFLFRGFDRRILPFDIEAARLYGQLMARRRKLRRPMSILDGQIAAIARAHGFAMATGNVRHFEDCGLRVLNPFESRR